MTPPRLRVHRAAREEIRAARRYYAARRVGLGRAFLAEVDAVLAFALEHPEMYPALDDAEPAVRRELLHRFPYALGYEVVAPASLVVLTCFDLRQEHAPDWQGGSLGSSGTWASATSRNARSTATSWRSAGRAPERARPRLTWRRG